MRVLHIYSGNLYGGIEAMLVTLARTRELAPNLEHEFALSFPGRLADELRANGATVHDLGVVRASRPLSLLVARRALAKVLTGGNFDWAIGHAAWPYAMFAKTVRRAGLPLAFWAHDAARGTHWTERWARRTRPDLAISNSNYTGATLGQLWPNVPATTIYCPVEDRSEQMEADHRRAVREELDTPAEAVVILQASRMEEWKGHHTLLSALALLWNNLNWHCWFAGGPQRPHEEEYFRMLKYRAQATGGAERIHFLGQRGDIPQLMAAADIYCQPNLTPEPFGIVLVEALYAGLPVVTSAMGGAAEIVNGSCGILTPPDRPELLAEALRSLIKNRELRAELAAVGPARAAELSDPARQARSLLRALQEHSN
jgi:glycosyltransferase involved in cell wall biosynthesis